MLTGKQGMAENLIGLSSLASRGGDLLSIGSNLERKEVISGWQLLVG